jgi:hypothetical protein
LDLDLTGEDERERVLTVARVSDEESGEGGQRWTPVMLPEVSDGDGG